MKITPIETDIFPEKGDLKKFLLDNLEGKVVDGDVLALSTKIVSFAEGQIVSQKLMSKEELVKKESDHYLGEIGYGIYLTIKDGLFIPSAGIDASNANKGQYVLFPKDPFASAKKIWSFLMESLNLKNLGIILVDSHTTPLRRGTTGIGLSYWGFSAVKDYRGKPDMFGNSLEYTYLNVVDSLSCMANYVMGEGDEKIPFAILRGTDVSFVDEVDPSEIQIPLEEDLYYPVFKSLLK